MRHSSGDLIADRRFAWAEGLLRDGDAPGAVSLFEQALDLAPGWAAGWVRLGEAREAALDRAGAIAAYREALARDARDLAGAGPRLARLGALDARGALSPDHVAALFDDYADRFDSHLTGALAYKGPALISEAIVAVAGERRFGSAVDLGCGTGLSGLVLRERCDQLIGVDLSAAMLARARERSLYDRLEQAGLVDWLGSRPPASLDLVVAADVLVYVGDLDPVFSGVARALLPGGVFAFSVQDGGEAGVSLGEDLRYAHSRACVTDACTAARLDLPALAPASTRLDRGRPVPGLIGVAVKGGEPATR